MSAHCFFSGELKQGDSQALLSPEESHHLAKVLRLKEGDEITILNGRGLTAKAILKASDGSSRHAQISCSIISETLSQPPCPAIRLYIAPPKGRNMDLLIKEAAELGVSRITPIICKYSVSRPDGGKSAWRQHLIVACKQSRNPWLPLIDEPMDFESALSAGSELDFLGAVPRPGYQSRKVNPEQAKLNGAALWIGPEGGFTEKEESALLDKGAAPITVGNWILRVETAVPALLGALYALLNTDRH